MDAAGPQLKVIANYAVGYNNIDVDAATARGIAVGNTPGVLTDTTADFAFALLMSAARRVVEGADFVRAGKWKTWGPTLLLGQDIHHATLGVIGFGRIGKGMARRATGFDMRILYHDPFVLTTRWRARSGRATCDLDTLYAESDFVSVHVPLMPANPPPDRRRDPAQDEIDGYPDQHLTRAGGGSRCTVSGSEGGDIAYAALDVTEPEPINMDNPLLTLPNCVDRAAHRQRQRCHALAMAEIAAQNLIAGVRGEPLPAGVNL